MITWTKVCKNFLSSKLDLFIKALFSLANGYHARKELWLIVQVAIFFGTVNY